MMLARKIFIPFHYIFHCSRLKIPRELSILRFRQNSFGPNDAPRSGMRHINKVRSISYAERKRERMKSARDARSDGGTRCRHFLFLCAYRWYAPSGLTRKSPVSWFYSSQTLTRVRNPRNVRAS